MGDAEIEAPADETVAITDIKLGDGEMADAGDTVNVGYKGQLGDASGATFDQAKSFTFTLGAGDVIKGWDQGESRDPSHEVPQHSRNYKALS